MRTEDAEAFEAVMQDLCLAFNRPYTAELSRSFWEPLKHMHVLDVRRAAEAHKRNGRKFPAPKELIPERRIHMTPPGPVVPRGSRYEVGANRMLLRAMMRCGKAVQTIDMRNALRVKADYVAMAEAAERDGEPMADRDYIGMCEEGFARVISQGGGCARSIAGFPSPWISA